MAAMVVNKHSSLPFLKLRTDKVLDELMVDPNSKLISITDQMEPYTVHVFFFLNVCSNI